MYTLNVQIISVEDKLGDITNPSDFLTELITVGLGQHQVLSTRQKSMAGVAVKAKEGVILRGFTPLGYDIVDGQYIINEREAPVVRLIFEMYAAGDNYNIILDEIKGIHGKQGQNLGKNGLYSILTNERYIGIYTWNQRKMKLMGKWVGGMQNPDCVRIENAIPIIIDQEIWERVQICSESFSSPIRRSLSASSASRFSSDLTVSIVSDSKPENTMPNPEEKIYNTTTPNKVTFNIGTSHKLSVIKENPNETATAKNCHSTEYSLSTKAKRTAFVDYVCLDLETTGLSPREDKNVEIAAVRYRNNEIAETFTTLVNPQIHISSRITKINEISDEMVKDFPKNEVVMSKLIEFIGTDVLVAHNVPFDVNFLLEEAKRENLEFTPYIVDTLKLSRKAFKEMQNHKLQTLASELNISVSQAHRSESDAIVCGCLLQKCLVKLNESKPKVEATL